MRVRPGSLVKRILGLFSRAQPPVTEASESRGPVPGPETQYGGNRIVHPPAVGARAIEINARDSLGPGAGDSLDLGPVDFIKIDMEGYAPAPWKASPPAIGVRCWKPCSGSEQRRARTHAAASPWPTCSQRLTRHPRSNSTHLH